MLLNVLVFVFRGISINETETVTVKITNKKMKNVSSLNSCNSSKMKHGLPYKKLFQAMKRQRI